MFDFFSYIQANEKRRETIGKKGREERRRGKREEEKRREECESEEQSSLYSEKNLPMIFISDLFIFLYLTLRK
jgi:hypothetical protein